MTMTFIIVNRYTVSIFPLLIYLHFGYSQSVKELSHSENIDATLRIQ